METQIIIYCGLAIVLGYVLYEIRRTLVKIQNQNLRLIQFYLDKKFITKTLAELNAAVGKSTSRLFNHNLENAKDYFQLEDILLYSTQKGLEQPISYNMKLNKVIAIYLEQNLTNIGMGLKHTDYISGTINYQMDQLELYTTYLDYNKKTLVIFVKNNYLFSLNRYEIETMIQAVPPLLELSLKFGAPNIKPIRLAA